MSARVGLELFHGRVSPDEELEGWGAAGPVFLVDYVHVTYWSDLKLGIDHPGGDGDLRRVDDLVYYDGMFYGDWSVFPLDLIATEKELAARVTLFEPAKAVPPANPSAPSCPR